MNFELIWNQNYLAYRIIIRMVGETSKTGGTGETGVPGIGKDRYNTRGASATQYQPTILTDRQSADEW